MTQLLSNLVAAILALFKRAPSVLAPAQAIEPVRTEPTAPSVKPLAPVITVTPQKAAEAPQKVAETAVLTWLVICEPFTQHFEGCVLTAYPDPASGGAPWTCGYGQTGAGITQGTVWTQAHADAQLVLSLNQCADEVDAMAKVPITPAQKAVLVDLTYNVGQTEVRGSKTLAALNAGNFAEAANELLDWDKADGKILPGLQARCRARYQLFTTGHWEAA